MKNKKIEAEALISVSISDLYKQGFLISGLKKGTMTLFRFDKEKKMMVKDQMMVEVETSPLEKNPFVRFSYIKTKDGEQIEESFHEIKLIRNYFQPPFEGIRYYMICPHCHRRIRKIFDINDDWRCNNCHKLTYMSRNLTPQKRHQDIAKIERLEAKAKVKYYRGKITKKYARVLKAKDQFFKSVGE